MPKATIQFEQSATSPGPGVAMIGVTGSAVSVFNATDDPSIVKWTFEIIDVPIGSTIKVGVNQDGSANLYKFTPDVSGGYLLHLIVQDAQGVFSEDFRVFQIAETSGRFIPSFASDAPANNFVILGVPNTRGWALGLNQYLKQVDAGGGGGGAVGPSGTVQTSDGAGAFVASSILDVNGNILRSGSNGGGVGGCSDADQFVSFNTGNAAPHDSPILGMDGAADPLKIIWFLEAVVVAQTSDHANHGSFKLYAHVSYDGGGNFTVDDEHSDSFGPDAPANGGALVAHFQPGLGSFFLRVNGLGGTLLTWNARITVTRCIP